MTDRRPTPRLALTVVAACALAGPVAADDSPHRYSDRKPAWYDPFGLLVSTPKPTTDKYGHTISAGGPDGSPAWKWYGYGAPTPGRNAQAPNGSYAPVPVNWHDLAGTTPGAVPLARLGTMVPTPLPEVLPIEPKPATVVPTAVPGKGSPFGPVLGGPPAIDPGWQTAASGPGRTASASASAAATLKVPVAAAEPAAPAVPPPGAALPNAGSESPDIPVEAAPGVVVPPLTTRGAAPERTALDDFAAVAKRADGPDARVLAVDVVGPRSAVVRLSATRVEAARAVRQQFADAPALKGWRINFELVTVLK